MKQILLSKGFLASVDDEEFESINSYKWTARISKDNVYAIRSYAVDGHRVYKYMHRFILGIEDVEIHVDHVNGNTLDNRKENLRVATRQQNLRNRTSIDAKNTSGFRGVYYSKELSKRKRPWYTRVRVGPGNKDKHLGYFSTAEEAARAFDKAVKEIYGEIYGEFCGKLNFD